MIESNSSLRLYQLTLKSGSVNNTPALSIFRTSMYLKGESRQ
jgi:hypothetical protein